jgi:hypothetical protein
MYADQAALFPALIDDQTLDEAQRLRWRQCALTWEQQEGPSSYLLALIQAPGLASSLCAHLARRMNVCRPDGREDVLRYYDPWIFRQLGGWLLSPEQLDGLLGPIEAWHWREPDGTWRTQERHCAAPSLRPLRLTPEQWPPLRRMAELNHVLATLARTDPALAWQLETAQQIDALLHEARARHDMQDRADRVLYALQAVRFHPGIHSHPLLRQRVEEFADDGGTYVEACLDLDDARMQQLVRELQTQQEHP